MGIKDEATNRLHVYNSEINNIFKNVFPSGGGKLADS